MNKNQSRNTTRSCQLFVVVFCLLSINAKLTTGADAVVAGKQTAKQITALQKSSDVASAKNSTVEKTWIAAKQKLNDMQLSQHEVKLANSQATLFLKNKDALLKEKQKTLKTATTLLAKRKKEESDYKRWLADTVKSIAYGKTTVPQKKIKLINFQKEISKAEATRKATLQKISATNKLIASAKKKEEKAKHQNRLKQHNAEQTRIAKHLNKTKKAMQQETKDLRTLEKSLIRWNTDNKKASVGTKKAIVQLTEATKAWQAADVDFKMISTKITSSNKTIAETPAKLKQFDQLIKTQQQEVNKQHQVLLPLQKDATVKLSALEKVLLANGKIVSFADKIAPVLISKCVVCHSHKKAEGRLNLQSYAGLLKGGESGEVIDFEDPEFSSLLTMIEDGSMPKDADPLSKLEIAVIKKWLTTGAQPGATTNKQASLIKIIPARKHPLPPKTYRVPLPVTALAFNPTGTILASSGYHEVLLWNPITGTLKQRISGIARRVHDVAFSPDGRQLAIAATTPGEVGELKIFDVADLNKIKQTAHLLTTEDTITAIAFSPNGRQIAAAGADRMVHLIDLKSKKEILTIKDHSHDITDVTFNSNGSQLATSCRDKTVRVFDVKTGELIKSFNKHTAPVLSVAFSTDGKQIISGGEDRRLRIWNIADGKEARTITGFGSHITQLTATPDGMIYTVSKDRKMYQHKFANSKLIKRYQYHTDHIYTLAVNYSENIIASGSHDGEIKVWSSETGKQLRIIKAVPTSPPKTK